MVVTKFTATSDPNSTLLFQFSIPPESITKSIERDINVWDIPFQAQNIVDDWVSTKITITLTGYFSADDGSIDVGKGGGTIQQMKDALEDLALPASDGSQPTMYLQSYWESSTRIQQVKIQRVTLDVTGQDPIRVKYTVECVAGTSVIA